MLQIVGGNKPSLRHRKQGDHSPVIRLHAAYEQTLDVRRAVPDGVRLFAEVDPVHQRRGQGYRRAGLLDERRVSQLQILAQADFLRWTAEPARWQARDKKRFRA